MRLVIRLFLLVWLALIPTGALAEVTPNGQSASLTLTVTIPSQPLAAEVLSPCAFVVTEKGHSAICRIVIAIADPTLENTGWRLVLRALQCSCTCGGTLPPTALTVVAYSDVTVINGQPVDTKGGPSIQAKAVGRNLSENAALLVAKPGFGNGAYNVTVDLRLTYPATAIPGTYFPTWFVDIAHGGSQGAP